MRFSPLSIVKPPPFPPPRTCAHTTCLDRVHLPGWAWVVSRRSFQDAPERPRNTQRLKQRDRRRRRSVATPPTSSATSYAAARTWTRQSVTSIPGSASLSCPAYPGSSLLLLPLVCAYLCRAFYPATVRVCPCLPVPPRRARRDAAVVRRRGELESFFPRAADTDDTESLAKQAEQILESLLLGGRHHSR